MTVSAFVLCFVAGNLGLVHGTAHIPQCNAQGWLEIREENRQSLPDVTCTGLPLLEFTWQLSNDSAETATVNCARENCTSTELAVRAKGISQDDRTSQLYIDNNHRELIGNGTVECLAIRSSASCRTNVINPAVLSNCEVTMTSRQTMAGTCHFHNAYSSNGTYTCTWTLTPLARQEDPDVIIPGVIRKTPYTVSGKLYYNGTCSFIRSGLPVGHHSYTVLFFPGSQYKATKTVTVIDFSPETKSDSSVLIAVIVFSVVLLVVVIAVIAVIIGLFIQKYRKSTPQGAGTGQQLTTTVSGQASTVVSSSGTVPTSGNAGQNPNPHAQRARPTRPPGDSRKRDASNGLNPSPGTVSASRPGEPSSSTTSTSNTYPGRKRSDTPRGTEVSTASAFNNDLNPKPDTAEGTELRQVASDEIIQAANAGLNTNPGTLQTNLDNESSSSVASAAKNEPSSNPVAAKTSSRGASPASNMINPAKTGLKSTSGIKDIPSHITKQPSMRM